MLLAKYAELILAGICFGENFAVVLVAVGFNLFAAHTHQVVDLLAYRSKLLGVFCWEWIEVVVHVLLDWVEHTAQRVDELLVAVGTQVEPGGIVMALIFQALGMTPIAWYEHIVLGGFCFGAVFMATDPVTSARTERGKYIFGFLIGVMAIVIRVLNPGYPEGMMLAILLMNIFAPLIDYCVVQGNISRREKRAIKSNN